jgi:hypothetical protein
MEHRKRAREKEERERAGAIQQAIEDEGTM